MQNKAATDYLKVSDVIMCTSDNRNSYMQHSISLNAIETKKNPGYKSLFLASMSEKKLGNKNKSKIVARKSCNL